MTRESAKSMTFILTLWATAVLMTVIAWNWFTVPISLGF